MSGRALARIPSIKISRRVLFDLKDIDKIMDSFKRSSNQCEMTANKIIRGQHGNGTLLSVSAIISIMCYKLKGRSYFEIVNE
ncbi:MAG: hypothetical protein ACYSR7_03960 [Planctomycetota bacterium]|jgi:hypothetical protein